MKDNLRAPPWKLVLQWGRQLAMDTSEIKKVSDTLSLRHALGKNSPLFFSKPHIKFILFQVLIPVTFPTVDYGKKQHPTSFSIPFFCPRRYRCIPLNLLSIYMMIKKLFFSFLRFLQL